MNEEEGAATAVLWAGQTQPEERINLNQLGSFRDYRDGFDNTRRVTFQKTADKNVIC